MEGMLKLKKPKKKESLIRRKEEKFDLDALEAEAVSVGLGVGDMGSRMDGKKKRAAQAQAQRERSEAEMRNNAYQLAFAKAEEAAKALRLKEQTHTTVQIALKKQVEAPWSSGPQASTTSSNPTADNQNPTADESQVVFTEVEEFVWGLQLDKESHKPGVEDGFVEEDEVPKASNQETKNKDDGWTEGEDNGEEGSPAGEGEEEVVPDETIHEVAIGKGLSGTLQLLKDRGTLKQSVVWGGRNMDKKKSRLVGIYENDGSKEIRIERTDEYGQILTPKEAFRLLSHKFHGKGPGKRKQEKHMREYQDELKVKQMKNADTPSLSVEKMIAIQARLKRPYLDVTRNT